MSSEPSAPGLRLAKAILFGFVPVAVAAGAFMLWLARPPAAAPAVAHAALTGGAPQALESIADPPVLPSRPEQVAEAPAAAAAGAGPTVPPPVAPRVTPPAAAQMSAAPPTSHVPVRVAAAAASSPPSSAATAPPPDRDREGAVVPTEPATGALPGEAAAEAGNKGVTGAAIAGAAAVVIIATQQDGSNKPPVSP